MKQSAFVLFATHFVVDAQVAAQTCSSRKMSACTADCGCQKVACCCGGKDCAAVGATINYNKCVPTDSLQSSWGCPSQASCAAESKGRFLTIATCPNPPTPQPTKQPTAPGLQPTATEEGKVFEFGTTFPFQGTQLVAKQTWQGNGVYMGTNMKFNKGAYFQYTDAFYQPTWEKVKMEEAKLAEDDVKMVDQPKQPTPAPDYTGKVCYSYMMPCPLGWYCQVNQGYNPSQLGGCKKEQTNTWINGGGEGWWNEQNDWNTQYDAVNAYTYNGASAQNINDLSYVHTPLVLDPNHNGGPGWSPYNQPFGMQERETCGGQSQCGYKSALGECWCDDTCRGNGDCCADIDQHCSTFDMGAMVNCNSAMGTCLNRCGLPKEPQAQCACDVECTQYGDCCCDYVGQCSTETHGLH